MMYWIVFALFTSAELFADFFLSFWFPFYYELKIMFLLYLLLPATKGSSLLYRKFVHPALLSREQKIDELIEAAQTRSYDTAVQLGHRSFRYVTGCQIHYPLKMIIDVSSHFWKNGTVF